MDSGCGLSQFPAVLFVTAQRAGAAVSGLHHGRWGACSGASVLLASALRGSLSRPRRVPLPGSVSGALVAQGAV